MHDDVYRYLGTTIGSSPIDQAVRAHQQARKDAKRYRQEAAKLLERIRRTAAAGHHVGAAHLRGIYCGSLCARFVAAEEQNKKLPRAERHNVLDLIALAKRLNAEHGTREAVHVHLKGKRDGGVRPICVFGFENRVLQQLVLTALEAGTEFHPAQFNVPGRGGMIAAKKALRDAYASGTYKYVVQLDVKNCYPSFTAMGVAENLPITRRVTNAVVMLDNLQITPLSIHTQNPRHRRAALSALTGLSQGSICSTIVQSILLSPLLGAIPASAFAVMWADNLIILFRTKAEAEGTLRDLHQAARQLPSGPIQLTDGGVGLVSGKEEFIGGAFQRRKGRPLVMPSASAKNAYVDGIKAILAMPPSEERERAFHARRRGFIKQHELWPEVEEWTRLRRVVVEAHMRPDFAKLRKAARYLYRNL